MSKKEKEVRVLCNCEWRHSLSILPLENRAKVYEAIFQYAETGEIPPLELVEQVAFEPIRKEIERYMDNYKETCEKRRQRALEREKYKREQGCTSDHKTAELTTTDHTCDQEGTTDHKTPQDPTNPNPNPSPNPNPNPNVPKGTDKNISFRRINSSLSKTNVSDDENEADKEQFLKLDIKLDKDTEERSSKLEAIKKGKEIAEYYNKTIKENSAKLRRCEKLTDKRIRLIQSNLNEYGEEKVKKTIDNAVASRFLNYEATNAPVDIDWIMNPDNFVKILEGKYENRTRKVSQSRNSRNYDPIDNKHINEKWK